MTEEFEIPDEDQELYEHYHYDVDKKQSLLRIDKFLMNRMESVSRSKIQAAANAGNILVNDVSVKPNYKVKPNDVISIVLAQPPREFELIPQNIPINIVYEDADIVIVNKDAGMVVHPGHGNYTGTLVNALIYHFQQLPSKGTDDVRPGLVHRIDKNTSGILLIAKNEIALAKLAKEFFDHTIQRKYVALVWGDFQEDEGTITGNIGRSLRDRKVMAVFPEGDAGRPAVTHYKVLERFGYITLIECQLETGRTHQIRVHMKYAGHPLFNDDNYGGDSILKGTTFSKYRQFIDNCFRILPRQALHAKSLGFVHPSTGKNIFFDSELPQDMQEVLDKWRRYISDKKNEFEDEVDKGKVEI
jgi:23S rRNA pseudouridine1911/1915/1917 synthase